MVITRTHVYVDGETLTAALLNNEFNNLGNAPAIVNADISASAAIAASKINLDTDNTLSANSDTVIASQKAVKSYADGKFNVITGLSSKIVIATRDVSLASGDVSYTGAGFTPTSVIALVSLDNTQSFHIGVADSSKTSYDAGQNSGGTSEQVTALCAAELSLGNNQRAILKTFDADGITLTWTKTGTPSGQTIRVVFMFFK